MADDTNRNPFLCVEDDSIENELEDSVETHEIQPDKVEIAWDAISAKLLKENFTLTALELHTELAEAGRELPRLRDYFSNPGNFERTREESPPTTLARTSSIQTFDSLDFARYSDDGERQVDERVAVLEFELRKAQDTIKSLRASLTKEAENEHVSPDHTEESKHIPGQDEAMRPLEIKALNFLVNQYLLQINNKLTSVTFAEENEDQDFEDWDDVGLNISQPPDVLHLYRDYNNHVVPSTDTCDAGNQTEMDACIVSLEQELSTVKVELASKENVISDLEEQLENKDKEMLARRGVAEGSESDQPPSPYLLEDKSTTRNIPLRNYSTETEHQSDADDDDDLDLEPDCSCDHSLNETCPVCVRVQSPEVYRIDFTELPGDQSGDQETFDSGSINGDEERSKKYLISTEKSDSLLNSNKDNINTVTRNGMSPECDSSVVVDGKSDKSVSSKNRENVSRSPSPQKHVKKKRTPKRSKQTGKESHIENGSMSPSGKSVDVELDIPAPDDQDQSNRKLSAAFTTALKDVCFYVTKDNRIVSEVSQIADADQERVVMMLGRCLPHIVPNVLLAKREELIPLIICTAMLHPEAPERDNLLNILFNLIKKPDEEQRQMILTGCIAFAQHVGPTRLEAELLPQCWEQINHKYMERRLLVAEACGALAAYLPNEMRSSLVWSMLQQMLYDDKEADVREAVVRSFGLLIGFICDSDKYAQGSDLLKTALRDSSERVVTSAKQIFLPSFAMWAYELDRLEHSLLHSILRDLEDLVKESPDYTSAIAQKSSMGIAPLNEGRYLLHVSTLQELIPFLYISVLRSGPYRDKIAGLAATVEEVESSRYPVSGSQLTDLTTIVGDSATLAAMAQLFEEHISHEWFEPWDSFNWTVNNLIPRLLEVVMGSALAFPRIVACLAKCFLKICRMFGKTFVDKKVKPRFIDVLLMSDEYIDPSTKFTCGSTPLTTCVVPVYASGVLSAFNTEEDQKQLSQFLREALFCLSIYQSSKDSLRIAITELCVNQSNHDLLLNVLWEGVVHNSAQVRATAARMFEILTRSVSEVVASTRVVPALVTLGNDPEIMVRIATIPALGSIIESITTREMLDRVYMQLQMFLDDPMYREEHSLHMELISTFARVAPNAEPKFRDEFVLPRLTAFAIENNNQSNEAQKKEVALQLFEAYSAMSCCFINYQLVQEALLPGLRCLRHDMAVIAPEHEEVITSMIREYESKIETSRPADRSSSFTGNFGTPSVGDDMKARMMSRLKESTAKANISSLFNRKK